MFLVREVRHERGVTVLSCKHKCRLGVGGGGECKKKIGRKY